MSANVKTATLAETAATAAMAATTATGNETVDHVGIDAKMTDREGQTVIPMTTDDAHEIATTLAESRHRAPKRLASRHRTSPTSSPSWTARAG